MDAWAPFVTMVWLTHPVDFRQKELHTYTEVYHGLTMCNSGLFDDSDLFDDDDQLDDSESSHSTTAS